MRGQSLLVTKFHRCKMQACEYITAGGGREVRRGDDQKACPGRTCGQVQEVYNTLLVLVQVVEDLAKSLRFQASHKSLDPHISS